MEYHHFEGQEKISRRRRHEGYLAQGSVQATLDADLQAEVRFGLDQSLTTEEDFLENIQIFIEQGEAW
ncbi:hypothetical protein [Microbacterium sp. MTN4-26]|uniref:hypothetical protein n=1 Tax=unclassified Microbacterium TaxID=2609290 RepID=UPI0036F2169B